MPEAGGAGRSNLGTMALEEGGRVDFARLRAARLGRCVSAMAEEGLDALVLGREANARYVSGARRLWNAGTRPFGPGCVVVADGGQVHLLSTWDDGVPRELPRQNLFGLSWNPANYARALAQIPGLAQARTIGVDGMSDSFSRMLAGIAPQARLVDGLGMLHRVRAAKLDDEVAAIATAVRLAEAALSHVVASLRPGMTEAQLQGAFERRMAELGSTVPGAEGAFCRTAAATGSPELNEGDLVAMSPSVLYAGYEGGLARTYPCPGRHPEDGVTPTRRQLHARWRRLWDALLSACRPGAKAAALLDAYRSTGEPLPRHPVAWGLGLGMEPPLVGANLPPDAGADQALVPGMVLSVGGSVSDGEEAYVARDTVLVSEDGPVLLSRHSHGPLAA